MPHYATCYNPGMETREHFADLFRQGIEQIQTAERETQEFRDNWDQAQRRINKVASEADQGLQDAGSDWHIFTRRENGGCEVWLTWTRDAQHGAGHSLRFEPIIAERKVRIRSGLDRIAGDQWDPAKLSDHIVAEKIGELLKEAVAQEVQRRRSGNS